MKKDAKVTVKVPWGDELIPCEVTFGTPRPSNLHHDSAWVPGDEYDEVEIENEYDYSNEDRAEISALAIQMAHEAR